MVTEIMVNALIGLGLGGGAGALAAVLGWFSVEQAFIARKFVTGLVTGLIAGLMIGFASVPVFANVTDDIALLVIYGEIFGSAVGVSLAAPKVSGAITTRLAGATETKPQ